jgi:hypothetical protein
MLSSLISIAHTRSAALAATLRAQPNLTTPRGAVGAKDHKGHKERTQSLTAFSFVRFVAFLVKKIPGLRQGRLRGHNSFSGVIL